MLICVHSGQYIEFSALLLRVILVVSCFQNFLRGIQSGQANLRDLSARSSIEDPSWYYWRSLSCCRVASYTQLILSGGVFVVSSWYRSPLMIQRASKFSRKLLSQLWEMFPGVPYLPQCLLLPWQKGLMGRSYLLSKGIYFVLLSFLLFCRGGEVKIEVNKKIEVRLVPSI